MSKGYNYSNLKIRGQQTCEYRPLQINGAIQGVDKYLGVNGTMLGSKGFHKCSGFKKGIDKRRETD